MEAVMPMNGFMELIENDLMAVDGLLMIWEYA
jgi:hypothetical protein